MSVPLPIFTKFPASLITPEYVLPVLSRPTVSVWSPRSIAWAAAGFPRQRTLHCLRRSPREIGTRHRQSPPWTTMATKLGRKRC